MVEAVDKPFHQGQHVISATVGWEKMTSFFAVRRHSQIETYGSVHWYYCTLSASWYSGGMARISQPLPRDTSRTYIPHSYFVADRFFLLHSVELCCTLHHSIDAGCLFFSSTTTQRKKENEIPSSFVPPFCCGEPHIGVSGSIVQQQRRTTTTTKSERTRNNQQPCRPVIVIIITNGFRSMAGWYCE